MFFKSLSVIARNGPPELRAARGLLMTRFFFHIRDQDEFFEDPEGVELDDLLAAQSEAYIAAREVLADEILNSASIGHPQFEICDDDGNRLLTVDFREVAGL